MAGKPTVWIPSQQTEDPSMGLPEAQQQLFKEHFNIVTYQQTKEDPSIADRIEGAMLIGPQYFLFVEQLPLMRNLKVAASCSVGVDRYDRESLRSRGIKLTNCPNAQNDAAADMAMALLLASARNLYSGVRKCMNLDKQPEFDLNTFGVEVTGSTLGVVGMGSIGLQIAKRAQGFDMKILYHNRNRREEKDEALVSATYYDKLSNMLPHCDFVVIACPLTPETRKLIGAAELRAMKQTSTLVNIARGAIVDQDALASALQSRAIRAAALDVTFPEPLPRDHPLLRLDNVIITPHISHATIQTRIKMLRMVINNLKAGLIDHTELPNEVPYSS